MSFDEFKDSPEYELWIKETDGHIDQKNYYRNQFIQRLAEENQQDKKDDKQE